jgi:hypothetical protein
MIYVMLGISVIINIILIWYGYKLIRKAFSYSDNIVFLMDDVDNFVEHLEAIYELSTYNGDETLQNLVLHSKKLRDDIKEFKNNSVLEVENDKEELIEYEEEEEEERS